MYYSRERVRFLLLILSSLFLSIFTYTYFLGMLVVSAVYECVKEAKEGRNINEECVVNIYHTISSCGYGHTHTSEEKSKKK